MFIEEEMVQSYTNLREQLIAVDSFVKNINKDMQEQLLNFNFVITRKEYKDQERQTNVFYYLRFVLQ